MTKTCVDQTNPVNVLEQIDLLTICYVVLKYNFIYLINFLIESSGSTNIRVKDKEIIDEI